MNEVSESKYNNEATKKQWLACVGPGWKSIVEPLVDFCFEHRMEIGQVKEKFGGLRFYMNSYESDGDNGVEDRNKLRKMIREAEEKSFKICEECGKPGSLRAGGWLRTLCDEHHSSRS